MDTYYLENCQNRRVIRLKYTGVTSALHRGSLYSRMNKYTEFFLPIALSIA